MEPSPVLGSTPAELPVPRSHRSQVTCTAFPRSPSLPWAVAHRKDERPTLSNRCPQHGHRAGRGNGHEAGSGAPGEQEGAQEGRAGRGWGQEKVSVNPRRAPTLPSMVWSNSAGTTAQPVLGGSQVPGGRRALGYREPEAEGPQGATGPLPRGPLDEATSWPEVSPGQSRPDEGSLGNGHPTPASALGRQTTHPPPQASLWLRRGTAHGWECGSPGQGRSAHRLRVPGSCLGPHCRPVCLHLQDHSATGPGLQKAGLLPPLSSAPLIGSVQKGKVMPDAEQTSSK